MTDTSEVIARLRHDLEIEEPGTFALSALLYSPSEKLTVKQITDLLDAAEEVGKLKHDIERHIQIAAAERDAALEEAAALVEEPLRTPVVSRQSIAACIRSLRRPG